MLFTVSGVQRSCLSGTLIAFKCKTHCQTQGSITYPLLDVRGWLSNICTACGHDARSIQIQAILTELKQKQTRLWLGLKENFTWCLISSFLLPVKGESEVYYVDLVLHFLVPVPPIMRFIISIPAKWKTDVAVMEGWRQWVAAGGWNGLITSRLSPS